MESYVLNVKGMTCAACAKRIENVRGKLDGISSASVNLATEKATIMYDPQKIRQNVIKESIEKIGYKASEADITDGNRAIKTM